MTDTALERVAVPIATRNRRLRFKRLTPAAFGLLIAIGGIKFPIAFFPSFMIPAQAWLWGAAVGAGTAVVGSFLPAWSARSVKVSEVFSKVS